MLRAECVSSKLSARFGSNDLDCGVLLDPAPFLAFGMAGVIAFLPERFSFNSNCASMWCFQAFLRQIPSELRMTKKGVYREAEALHRTSWELIIVLVL